MASVEMWGEFKTKRIIPGILWKTYIFVNASSKPPYHVATTYQHPGRTPATPAHHVEQQGDGAIANPAKSLFREGRKRTGRL